MAYGQFKSIAEVVEKFDIHVADRARFIEQKTLDIFYWPAIYDVFSL